MKTQQT